MRYLFAPILYSSIFLAVTILTTFSVFMSERLFGLHVIFRKGDVDMVVYSLLWGVPLYGVATYFLLSKNPTTHGFWKVHFQHTAFLYAFSTVFFLAAGKIIYDLITVHNSSVGMGVYLVFFPSITLFVGIFINLFMVRKHVVRRREQQSGAGVTSVAGK